MALCHQVRFPKYGISQNEVCRIFVFVAKMQAYGKSKISLKKPPHKGKYQKNYNVYF